MGNEEYKAKYRPLLPNCNIIIYNNEKSLENITTNTAAVVLEVVQGGTGFVTPVNNFLQKVREKCNETGTLLIFDEIQSCYGRLGTLFGFEKYEEIPEFHLKYHYSYKVLRHGMQKTRKVQNIAKSAKLVEICKRC